MWEIAAFAGYPSWRGGNIQYGTLAGKVRRAIGLPFERDQVAALVDFIGDNARGESTLRIHHEVITGLAHSGTQIARSATDGDAEDVDAFHAEALRMAETAYRTAAAANGQEVTSRAKIKDFEFASRQDAADHVRELLETQKHRCALTNLPLHFDADVTDPAMLCSLDRIDSSGHYEKGNLQVVCRFANQWKSNGSDAEFRRLVALLRSTT